MAKKNNAESGRISETYLPIEDYGIIGDLHTLALVGKNGSIDFCCIPAFDAPSVFGAILDAQKGGFFRIAPPDSPGMARTQHYVPLTNILTTSFLPLMAWVSSLISCPSSRAAVSPISILSSAPSTSYAAHLPSK